jgi:hypothetical protein
MLGCDAMGFLSLYLDESGHSAMHPVVVVAGLIGQVPEWDGFAEAWNGILSRHGVIPPFHMADFEAKQDQFRGWDEQTQRRPLLAELMREIVSRRLGYIGCAVNVPWFKGIDWTKYSKDAKPLEDPYHLAFQDVIRGALILSNSVPELHADKMAVMVEQQGEYGGKVNQYYGAMCVLSSKLVKANILGDPVEFPQLQAADILAFEFRQKINRPELARYPMREIMGTGRVELHSRGFTRTEWTSIFPLADIHRIKDELVFQQKGGSKSERNQGKRSRRKR